MKLSIIICVYNTATDYLVECLESITNSTLKSIEGDYEICMVDDGSTVDYTEIVNTYRVKYVKTENRGILAARTTGIAMASGEYAAFCDSDDSVSFHYHLAMLQKAEQTGADIVINDWAFHTPRIRYYCQRDDLIHQDLDISGDRTLLAFVGQDGKQHSFYVLWNKLYRTELLRGAFASLAESSYPKDSSYSEDAAVNFFAWRDASRVVNIHTGFYFYRIHESQSVNVVSAEKLRRQINSMAACLGVMRESIGNNEYKEEILSHIRSWEELMARSHYSHAAENEYTELYDLLREQYHVTELARMTPQDGAAYTGNILLGTNFQEVDAQLLSLWNAKNTTAIAYGGNADYVNRAISLLANEGKVTVVKKKLADVIVTDFEISLRTKIVHNDMIYRIGSKIFKKGSKLRKILKKLL